MTARPRRCDAGVAGNLEKVREFAAQLNATGIATADEAGAQKAAESFAHFRLDGTEDVPLALSWWVRPYPGNFGDWLSPLILQNATSRPIKFVPLTEPTRHPNLVMVGSVGRWNSQARSPRAKKFLDLSVSRPETPVSLTASLVSSSIGTRITR